MLIEMLGYCDIDFILKSNNASHRNGLNVFVNKSYGYVHFLEDGKSRITKRGEVIEFTLEESDGNGNARIFLRYNRGNGEETENIGETSHIDCAREWVNSVNDFYRNFKVPEEKRSFD